MGLLLRYLGSGCNFVSLGLYFGRGEATVGQIIKETTDAIWSSLKESHMQVPTQERWRNIADRFMDVWQLSNCLGAIDGKHIRIQKYPNSGSTNYNYKDYHSIILLGCCDADGYFTMIDTGFAGRNSDGGAFRVSRISQLLGNNANFPDRAILRNDDTEDAFPYYFVCDNAFPLQKNLMRPFPERNVTNIKRVYNYRISRARKTIECTFGMMVQKFPILLAPIKCRNYKTIVSIIKCVCILHNFVRSKDGEPYAVHDIDETRTNAGAGNLPMPSGDLHIDTTSSPQILREYLMNYFVKPRVALPWQNKYCI